MKETTKPRQTIKIKMGTNYYRIPLEKQVEERKKKLQDRIESLDLSPSSIERKFSTIKSGEWETTDPWHEFIEGITVHLGKRSSGWKFCWNFHEDKYYSDKEELLKFIREGRVVNEYGEDIPPEEFIEMALNWGEPEGAVYDQKYIDAQLTKNPTYWYHPSHLDRYIDGLRISSSTDFC
jgi:hypothetical protein